MVPLKSDKILLTYDLYFWPWVLFWYFQFECCCLKLLAVCGVRAPVGHTSLSAFHCLFMPSLMNGASRHTIFRFVRLWVSAWVCAFQKPCEHHILKTNEGNFTQFWLCNHWRKSIWFVISETVELILMPNICWIPIVSCCVWCAHSVIVTWRQAVISRMYCVQSKWWRRLWTVFRKCPGAFVNSAVQNCSLSGSAFRFYSSVTLQFY